MHNPHFCQQSEKVGAALIVTGESGAETTPDNNRKTMKHIALNIFSRTYYARLSLPLLLNSEKETNIGERSKFNYYDYYDYDYYDYDYDYYLL